MLAQTHNPLLVYDASRPASGKFLNHNFLFLLSIIFFVVISFAEKLCSPIIIYKYGTLLENDITRGAADGFIGNVSKEY